MAKTKAAEAAVVVATRTLLPRVPVPHYHQMRTTIWKSSSTSKVLPMDQTSNSNGSHPPHRLLQINHSSGWASFLHCFSNVLPLSIAPSKCSSSLHCSDSNCTPTTTRRRALHVTSHHIDHFIITDCIDRGPPSHPTPGVSHRHSCYIIRLQRLVVNPTIKRREKRVPISIMTESLAFLSPNF